MPILQSELVKRGAVNRPQDDVSSSGGGMEASCSLEITQLAANDVVRAVSDDAGDNTQSLTVTGRLPSGSIDTDVISLNGLTPIAGTKTFERILELSLSAAAAGNVICERNTGGFDDVAILPPGITDASILFINSESEASPTVRYEQEIWQNLSGSSLDLLNATLTLTADPGAVIMMGVAVAKNGTTSVANRKTAPGGVAFVDDGVVVNLPGGTLEYNAYIETWISMSLSAGAAPLKSSYTTELAGSAI